MTKAMVACAVALLAAACGGPNTAGQTRPSKAGTLTPSVSARPTAPTASPTLVPPVPGRTATRNPAPHHIVLVVLENHSYGQIIGNPAAPFVNQLARDGALFTHSFAVTHPSEPNYLALFSGSTQGVDDDSCPHTWRAPNLAASLAAAGKSFTGYAEGLPSVGSAECDSGDYARRHVPWVDFANVPAAQSRPFSDFPARDPASLPTVSWVIPNVCHDMHDCSVATGDGWLRQHLGPYLGWAKTHQSLLIVTFDEDDGNGDNHIATLFAGEGVKPGRYATRITHYNVLATIEAVYGLHRDGHAASAAPVTGIWSGR